MGLHSQSCPKTTDKYLVSENAWLLSILQRENKIRKGSAHRLFSPRSSLLPTKSSTYRLLSSDLKGIQCFFLPLLKILESTIKNLHTGWLDDSCA